MEDLKMWVAIPCKKFNKEKEFQSFFGKLLKEHGCFYHKISDQSMGLKPCDCFFVTWQGHTYYAELKNIEGYTLALRSFEPQQVEWLTKVSKLGGEHSRCLAVVYSKKLSQFIILPWPEIYPRMLEGGSAQVFLKSQKSSQ